MDLERRRVLIERYRAGPSVVEASLAGAAEAELDARPAAGGWTAREVAHHLPDSEMTAAIRLRRLIVEDQPVIQGYDQDLFARRLHYGRPIASSVAALAAVRAVTADLLDCLTDDEWLRAGTHSDSGAYSVLDWLEIYAAHAHDHADQIRQARASRA